MLLTIIAIAAVFVIGMMISVGQALLDIFGAIVGAILILMLPFAFPIPIVCSIMLEPFCIAWFIKLWKGDSKKEKQK